MKITVVKEPIWHVIIDEAFGTEKNKEIFTYILSLEEAFSQATVKDDSGINKDKSYRNNLSLMLDNLYDCSGEWEKRKDSRKQSPLLGAIDGFMESQIMHNFFSSAPLPFYMFLKMNTWETQVSRYGKKNFYNWHVDNIHDENKRIISLVYYFFEEPKSFIGGELMLTDGCLLEHKELIGETKRAFIEPKNDRLVIFSSNALHCVKNVEAPDEFRKGRFSVNVWAGIS